MFARFGVFYLLYSALWGCSSHPFSFQYNADDSKLVCREMASARQHLTPIVHDFSNSAHKFLEPYAGTYMKHAGDSWQKAKPYVSQTGKHAHSLYWTHFEPKARDVYKGAHAWSRPHQRNFMRQYKRNVHPHIDGRIRPACTRSLAAARKAMKPYTDV